MQEEEVRIVAPLILAELSLELSKEEEGAEQNPLIYDMEKYREMILMLQKQFRASLDLMGL